MRERSRVPGILGVLASLLGLFFSAFSTHDYASNLDRQLHATHCSFVPGLAAAEKGENACKAAMISPYSALFKDRFWGGIPISLFALGVYGLFFAVSLYLVLAPRTVTQRGMQAYGIGALLPLGATFVMFFITLTKLDEFCKLCIGLYCSSILLAISGILALLQSGGTGGATITRSGTTVDPDKTEVDPIPPWQKPVNASGNRRTEPLPKELVVGTPVRRGSITLIPTMLAGLGVFALAPALVYAGSLPDYKTYVLSCGKISETTESHGAFVKVATTSPVQPALTFEDPLCPTCKAFHQRLVAEGAYERLDLTVAIFPLDADCNFLMDGRTLHPGACVVAKAFLCADKSNNSRAVLEWAYQNQDELTAAGKNGNDAIRAKVKARFPDVDKCIDEKATQAKLDHIFHFAVDHELRVITPQLYLGDTRVCDEDTDIGLSYALGLLAPKVKK